MAVGLTCCWALVVSCLLCCSHNVRSADFHELDNLRPSSTADTQADAVIQLIHRLLPERAQDFKVTVDPSIGPANRDTFQLVTSGSQLSITGTSGVAAALGLQYYLKHYCGCHISWAGDQLNLPATLPAIGQPGVKVTSNDRFRYYQNVCTVSYSFVWWNWTRWEREIDWMVLNGINLPLAFNGQEAVWQRVYLKMGFTQQELDAHFGGPAFLAWARMGNMRGWGGPLLQTWHTQQVALQHQILQRMRSFGMFPVLPAFAGHVPRNITRLFPKVNVSLAPDWGGFPAEYCCTTLLDVEDPLFQTIGKAFITEYTREFGTDHIYNADTFNELNPKSSNVSYLAAVGKAIFGGMTGADPVALWLLQGWMFYNEMAFWQPAQAKALLTSVPQGRLIVLDLMAEEFPQYSRLSSYFGQPFIWCMLHNFGGTLPMYGDLQSVNTGPLQGRSYYNSTMVGTGVTPEGINQNDVVYEFMNENSWRHKARNISEWISDYAKRRYGRANAKVDQAWNLLQQSVYNSRDQHRDFNSDVIINTRPRLASPLNPAVWYQPETLYMAWDYFIEAADTLSHSALFKYDLVDVTRQSLQVIAIKYYVDLITHYKARQLEELIQAGTKLLDLLIQLDSVLGTDEHFLLGRWLEGAKAWGTTPEETQLYEFNARNQITLWGPNGNILDYASKQWSGLISGYYLPRWELFVKQLQTSLEQGVPFDENKFREDVFNNVEKPFSTDRSIYPKNPVGNSVQEAKKLHQQYRPMTKANALFFAKLPKWSKTRGKFVRHSTRWRRRHLKSNYVEVRDSLNVFKMVNKIWKQNDIV